MEMTLRPSYLLIFPASQNIDRIMAHPKANPRPRAFAGNLLVDGLCHRHVHPGLARSQRSHQRDGLPTLLHARKYRPAKTRRLALQHTSPSCSPAKTRARSCRQSICPALRPSSLVTLRPFCPDVLPNGANSLALAECCHLRSMWLSGVEAVLEFARRTLDRAGRRPGLPRILSPDFVGPDLRSCSPLLHARISRTQRRSALPRWYSDRISNFQTTTRPGSRNHFFVRPRVEGDRHCDSGGFGPTQCRLALLRHSRYERISALSSTCGRRHGPA